MKTYRDGLLAKLHILFKEQGVDDDIKREIYTSYGVTTAADMTDYQLGHLCLRLEGREVGTAPVIRPRQEVSPETRRLRSQCLALMTKSPTPASPKLRGLGLPNDWAVINPFVQHHAGATLNKLSDGALMDLVKKLRKIRDSGWFYRPPRPAAETTTDQAAPAVVFVTTQNDNPIIN